MYRAPALFVLGCLLSLSVAYGDERVAIPPDEEIEKASKLVRELFKDEYAKTTPKAKLALAEKLFKQAAETPDNPAAQFVLLRETAELAAAGGNAELAIQAVEQIRTRFTGIKSEQIESLLKTVAAKASTPDACLSLANFLLRMVDDAVVADDLEAAERLVKMASSAAFKSKNVRLAGLATERVKEVEGMKKDSERVKVALKTLETNPQDPAASTVVGKYYCFQKENWEKGLPLLAAGDDAKLKKVAEKELAKPKESAEVLAVADEWYEVGMAAPGGYAKRAMLERAYQFYAKVVSDLAGLNRTRVEKRMEELEKSLEGKGVYDDLWNTVRVAIRAKETEDLNPLGGALVQKAYRDLPPSVGVLIGFQYTTKKFADHDVMDYMRPIYLTPAGEKLGTGYGKVPAKFQVVKAKPGYAVAALKVRGGGLFEGYGITFMRIQGKGLNPADKYESAWMGRNIQTDGLPVVGDSRPVIGIHGKLRHDGDQEICTIGLIVAGPKPKK